MSTYVFLAVIAQHLPRMCGRFLRTELWISGNSTDSMLTTCSPTFLIGSAHPYEECEYKCVGDCPIVIRAFSKRPGPVKINFPPTSRREQKTRKSLLLWPSWTCSNTSQAGVQSNLVSPKALTKSLPLFWQTRVFLSFSNLSSQVLIDRSSKSTWKMLLNFCRSKLIGSPVPTPKSHRFLPPVLCESTRLSFLND